jgi:hypothetical protein
MASVAVLSDACKETWAHFGLGSLIVASSTILPPTGKRRFKIWMAHGTRLATEKVLMRSVMSARFAGMGSSA